MTLLYPNPCYNRIRYKEAALYIQTVSDQCFQYTILQPLSYQYKVCPEKKTGFVLFAKTKAMLSH